MKFSTIVYIGAVNWAHSGWREAFYPGDLPEDWLLSYYNTQFQAVFLQASVWQAASEATWAQWLCDTQDTFCFVLEADGADAVKPVSERVLLATPAWEASHVWWLDETPDMRALAQRIARQVETGKPLFVFSRSGNIDLLQQARALRQVMGY
jgi:hypothetical protein